MWRLFWQYRHCCSDTWQKKQGDHPHGDLTELIVGPENGQLAVERDACVWGRGRKWDSLAKNGKRSSCAKKQGLKWEKPARWLSWRDTESVEPQSWIGWGQLGFCGLHRKVFTENQISVCLWSGGSGPEVQNGWEMVCLFLKSHWRNENRLHLQLAMNFF